MNVVVGVAVFAGVLFLIIYLPIAIARRVFRVDEQIQTTREISEHLKTLVQLEKMRKH